jgi:hypothetical protein
MKASFVAYDCRELYKKSELKIVKYGYVKGSPKRPTTQIGLLEILRVKKLLLSTTLLIIEKKKTFSLIPNI